MPLSYMCRALSGRCLCKGPITRPESPTECGVSKTGSTHKGTLHVTRQRVQSLVCERMGSKLDMPVTRRNEEAGQSASSEFDISEMN